MKLKTICFIVLPLLFFGCGAYSYMSRAEERAEFKKMPENKKELQQHLEQLHSKQAEKKSGRKG